MQTIQLVISIMSGLGALAITFKVFFGGLDGFMDAIRYWFTPDALSFFRGEWQEDQWAEFKILVWLGTGGIVGAASWAAMSAAFS